MSGQKSNIDKVNIRGRQLFSLGKKDKKKGNLAK